MAREGETILKFPSERAALMEWYWAALFFVSALFNLRASFKLLARLEGHADDVPLRGGCLQPPGRASRRGCSWSRRRRPRCSCTWCRPSRSPPSRAPCGCCWPRATRMASSTWWSSPRRRRSARRTPPWTLSTAELVRRFRAELPPYQQKMLSQLAMPGHGPQSASTELGAPGRAPHSAAGRGLRSAPGVHRRERCRLGARSQRVPLDRRRRHGAGRRPHGLPGGHALPGQLRSAAREGTGVRGPAVVDLHPRLDRAAHQRGPAGTLVHPRDGPRPAPGRGLCDRSSSSRADVRRSVSGTTSSCASTC